MIAEKQRIKREVKEVGRMRYEAQEEMKQHWHKEEWKKTFSYET